MQVKCRRLHHRHQTQDQRVPTRSQVVCQIQDLRFPSCHARSTKCGHCRAADHCPGGAAEWAVPVAYCQRAVQISTLKYFQPRSSRCEPRYSSADHVLVVPVPTAGHCQYRPHCLFPSQDHPALVFEHKPVLLFVSIPYRSSPSFTSLKLVRFRAAGSGRGRSGRGASRPSESCPRSCRTLPSQRSKRNGRRGDYLPAHW